MQDIPKDEPGHHSPPLIAGQQPIIPMGEPIVVQPYPEPFNPIKIKMVFDTVPALLARWRYYRNPGDADD
jgi:hypothetical protein